MAQLPVSNLVSVQVNLAASPAQSQSLSNILILGSSDVIDVTQRIRTYSTESAVATDFGTTAPEFLAAQAWFSQAPQPTQVSIGEWAEVAVAGRLIGGAVSVTNQNIAVWNAITNGGFSITIDGGSAQHFTGLNFSSVTNLNGVASVINVALVGAVVTWNATYQQFTIKSNTTGTISTVSFGSAPTTGGVTDISTILAITSTSSGAYVVDGIAAESAVSAVALFDTDFGQSWYGLFVAGASDADHLDIAEYIEGTNTKHFYGVNTQEAGTLSSVSTSDIGYQLSQLGFKKTSVQYSSTSLYSVVSLLGRILTTDYNANSTVITLMYKQEPGIKAESINQTQLLALISKNVNVFVGYDNKTTIIQPGVTSSGDFIDTIIGADWLSIDIQNTLFNLLYSTPTKIPQTNAGNHVLAAGIISVLDQGVANGLLAPGTWTQAGFGTLNQGDYLPKGYYVWVPDIATQNPADRAARKSVTFQAACKLAGAIQTVSVLININR